jgi:uncharacterized OB-fold protein
MANERDEVHPFSDRVDSPYWEGLSAGELRVQRCEGCQAWRWPADWRCPACGSYDLGWEPVDPEGLVYSWIRTQRPFVAAYADLVPYVNVLVELPSAGGARLLGLLAGETDGVEIGAAVVGDFSPASRRTVDLPVLVWRLADAR